MRIVPWTCSYIDARSGEIVSEGNTHEGTKASRAIFVSDDDMIFTTGFSRMSERQWALRNPKDLSKPIKMETIDTGSGVLFATYDPDTRMVWLAGKVRRAMMNNANNVFYYYLRAMCVGETDY